MIRENNFFKLGRDALILALSVSLVLFVQWIKLLKNSKSTPITTDTFIGLGLLWLFSLLGIIISMLMKRMPWKIVQGFPILGWVSIVSLIFCLISSYCVRVINAVDFLSLTTSVLAFAGISVTYQLKDLSKISWKILIVALFVFFGMYFMDALISQIALNLSGK
ncbi:hypothetical protein [Lactobacillus kefiranofaciens]|uniref:Tripartite tricarboxylate transporter TctB family protein n=1 Tax=Lactobacillus kefiranofaciens TaxID=267818 RepID=A0AAX3UGA9_9LACO|nr:hypothetical protein [Lactobacillus kefiranofaciens]AEG39906.1 Hypothetical protein WANG_0211 [Lactobacillus kefiranofaciens subsp. kefiranofaciens]KRM21892.1 hypothetical protein FC93_GL002261 [Lactobacillus kefiranofaciens subsp. kefiranofaciens DSM 5016 = JCM 6985]MCJ2172623.1 hypothetical protein [Lactobacillus kefiranofaciens]MCP9331326.1 hypothetical protein [Lactobacillus kefiranofaciens]MDF4141623.1 hypothetical protein [Lactobacillus kefiranofaciens]